jgi:hypothetical protein
MPRRASRSTFRSVSCFSIDQPHLFRKKAQRALSISYKICLDEDVSKRDLCSADNQTKVVLYWLCALHAAYSASNARPASVFESSITRRHGEGLSWKVRKALTKL